MNFVLPPEEIDLENSKIKTLRILTSCHLPRLEVKIITPAAFAEYYKNRKISPKLLRTLAKVLEPLLKWNHVSIRTAVEKEFDVLLPRSEGLTDVTSCLRFIKKTWDFFIQNSPKPLELGVALLVHEFVPSFAAGTLDSSFSEKDSMIIEAIYGIWEGIQSGLHDIYVVNKKTCKLVKEIIPSKDFALFSTASGKWRYQKVPSELKTKQVVSDEQIVELCEQTKKVEEFIGPIRIEFILKKMRAQGLKEAVLLWHILPLKRKSSSHYYKTVPIDEETTEEVVFTGFPIEVRELEDIKKLKLVSCHKPIIYLGSELISKRDLFAIQLVASLAKEKGWPVLYKGGLLTHINIILREYGVRVFSVNQEVSLGKEIKIVEDEIV